MKAANLPRSLITMSHSQQDQHLHEASYDIRNISLWRQRPLARVDDQ